LKNANQEISQKTVKNPSEVSNDYREAQYRQ